MIQGRFVKGEEVTELISDGMEEILPEKSLQHFSFPRREIEMREHIETLTTKEMLTLALAAGGTLAALIIAIALLDFSTGGRIFFAAIGVLDGWLLTQHLRREEEA